MIYCIFLSVTGIMGLLTLIFYTWYLAWCFYDSFSIRSTALALIYPGACLFTCLVYAWGMGAEDVSDVLKWITVVILAFCCAITIAVAAYFSIKKYRKEGYAPNYAAFLVVCGYSAILAGGSALLAF
ncbi:MAG: hypothetical protein IJ002_03035 [Clostridia bacterium]|nr:hypothetical protein [Clostridia bacterium]MBQ8836466.1 hypothetical protein [Clostridia bacterium]